MVLLLKKWITTTTADFIYLFWEVYPLFGRRSSCPGLWEKYRNTEFPGNDTLRPSSRMVWSGSMRRCLDGQNTFLWKKQKKETRRHGQESSIDRCGLSYRTSFVFSFISFDLSLCVPMRMKNSNCGCRCPNYLHAQHTPSEWVEWHALYTITTRINCHSTLQRTQVYRYFVHAKSISLSPSLSPPMDIVQRPSTLEKCCSITLPTFRNCVGK